MNDLTFLVRIRIEESALLSMFDRETGLSCDSVDHPRESAVAFLMRMEFEEGFPFGVSLTWPKSFTIPKSRTQMAQSLANEFKTEVLFESETSVSDTDAEKWLLASPGRGTPRVVAIKELAKGVCLATEA